MLGGAAGVARVETKAADHQGGRDGVPGVLGGRFKCPRRFGGSVARPDNGVSLFDARVEREDNTIALRLTGEFDLAATDDFEAGVADALSAPLSELVLDLRGLRFVDSTGLRSILTLWERSSRRASRFPFSAGPPRCRGHSRSPGSTACSRSRRMETRPQPMLLLPEEVLASHRRCATARTDRQPPGRLHPDPSTARRFAS